MATLVPSACPYDCPDCCGLLAEVEDGRVVGVRGDPAHPYSRGSLCPKMVHYERTVNHPDRLTHPLIRDGAKGAGRFRRAGWDEAIDLVARRWKELAAAHGPEAILPYSYAGTMGLVQRNAGHAFFHRLGASQLARTICSPAKDAGLKAILGDTPGLDPAVVAGGDLVILWGVNAVAANLHLLPHVKEARRKGARVWLVDTHRTATAAVVDRVFAVRPGSDGALCLGLIHLLARLGLADEPFLAAEAQGWPELRAAALADHPPARTSALTGLDEAALLDLARGLAGARAPVIRIGEGLSRYGNGAMNVRSIAALAAVAGVMARPGGFYWGASSSAAFPLDPFTRPDLMARPTRTINMNRLGQALGSLDGPRVMSICVYASNPAAVAPDQNAVLRGLGREDLFTVVHERFLTDTARFADVLLPATTSLEHADLYRSYGHYVVQRARAAIPPLGEALPNWELFRRLARAFDFEGSPFDLDADGVIDLLLDTPSPWRDGFDRAALDAGRPVTLRPPPGPRWRTPSGKVELLNPRHREPLPRLVPTHAAEGAFPLRLQTGPAIYSLNSTFMDRDDLAGKRGPLRVRLSPADAAARRIADGARVVAFNELGEVAMVAEVTAAVADGLAVVEGVHWLRDTLSGRNVNALTSQRLTDEAGGSTFYDNRVDVRPAGG
jgi:anaerobic selenocysteine-containing dehydrogenase